jgi:thiol-disulfide isomerase/thioredoxin
VFLAHWCPHCQAEVPRLVALAKAGKLDGLAVTGVATGTSSAAPNYPPSAWLQREHWPFPVMADSKTNAAARAFGVSGYPTFVLIDGSGKVVGRAAGEVSDADIVANVKALVAGEPLPLLQSGASSSAS